MPPAAEKLPEDIEWISASSSASTAALLVLRHALVAVLIINPSQFIIGEDFVGLGDFDEALVRGFVVGVFVRVVLFGEFAVGFFELAGVGVFGDGEQFVIIFGGEGQEGEEAQECEREAG